MQRHGKYHRSIQYIHLYTYRGSFSQRICMTSNEVHFGVKYQRQKVVRKGMPLNVRGFIEYFLVQTKGFDIP